MKKQKKNSGSLALINLVDQPEEDSQILGSKIISSYLKKNKTKSRKRKKIDEEEEETTLSEFDSSIIALVEEKSPLSPEEEYLANIKLAQERLQLSYFPNELLCRDEEKGLIQKFWKNCLENHIGGSLYISGSPGTGKSACVDEIVTIMQKEKNLRQKILQLNCMEISSPSAIFCVLAERLRTLTKSSTIDLNNPIESLQAYLTSPRTKNMIVFILDEIDHLVTSTKSQQVLNQLFEWSSLPNSSLILIGIANILDMTERFIPLCKKEPVLINFQRYSKEQIKTILQNRLQDLSGLLFDPKALELVAGKVSNHSGDLRKALELSCKCLEKLELTIRNSNKKKDSESSTFQNVKISLMSKLCDSLESNTVETITTLPTQQKLLLCSALRGFKTSKTGILTFGTLYDCYTSACKTLNLPLVSSSDFKDLCECVKSAGFIEIDDTTSPQIPRRHKIILKISEDDILFALKDRIFQSILVE